MAHEFYACFRGRFLQQQQDTGYLYFQKIKIANFQPALLVADQCLNAIMQIDEFQDSHAFLAHNLLGNTTRIAHTGSRSVRNPVAFYSLQNATFTRSETVMELKAGVEITYYRGQRLSHWSLVHKVGEAFEHQAALVAVVGGMGRRPHEELGPVVLTQVDDHQFNRL